MNDTTKNLWFWLSLVAIFLIAIYLLRSILLPFVLGMAMAYFLDPAADKLERWKLSRTNAALLITGVFFSAIVIALIIAIPILAGQLAEMMAAIPGYVERFNQNVVPVIEQKIAHVSPAFTEEIKKALSSSSGTMAAATVAFFGSALSSGMAFVNVVLLLLITPIVAFYLLRDWDKIVIKLESLVPRSHVGTVNEQVAIIDRTLSGFVRGQLTVCLLLGIFYALGLTLAGLNFGFIIGLATGLLAILPYVGLAMGMIVGLLVAFFQFSDVSSVAIVAAIFAVGQFIEGNFITPKLVGDKVGLHPVWMIFAMLAGAALFGFVGALLAVPVAAILGVLIRFALRRYEQSAYFLLMSQYVFDIALPASYADAQFIVTGSNRLAWGWVAQWPDWLNQALYLHGEQGSGKTHLAHMWQRKSSAAIIPVDSEEFPAGPAIVETVEDWQNEAALFHLYNHCRLNRVPLLLTSRLLTENLPFRLPDLRSRLNAMQLVSIAPPDDELMQAVLAKQLGDRQLKITPDTLDYVIPRLPRTFKAIDEFARQIDRESLGSGRTLTIPFIKKSCGW